MATYDVTSLSSPHHLPTDSFWLPSWGRFFLLVNFWLHTVIGHAGVLLGWEERRKCTSSMRTWSPADRQRCLSPCRLWSGTQGPSFHPVGPTPQELWRLTESGNDVKKWEIMWSSFHETLRWWIYPSLVLILANLEPRLQASGDTPFYETQSTRFIWGTFPPGDLNVSTGVTACPSVFWCQLTGRSPEWAKGSS